jgi:hypothetical protein
VSDLIYKGSNHSGMGMEGPGGLSIATFVADTRNMPSPELGQTLYDLDFNPTKIRCFAKDLLRDFAVLCRMYHLSPEHVAREILEEKTE